MSGKILETRITDIGTIACFLERNVRHDKISVDNVQTKNLVKSMLNGWKPDSTIIVRKISKADLELWMERLASQHAVHVEASRTSQEALIRRMTWEDQFMVDPLAKSPKFKKPEFVLVTGHRRWVAAQEANFQVASGLDKEQLKDLRNHVPIRDVITVVKHYVTEKDLILDQIAENELKAVGTEALTPRDILLAAEKVLSMGGNQAELRRFFGDAGGQRAYHLTILHHRFERLDLFNRLTDPDHPRAIPFRKVNYGKLAPLTRRTDPDALAKYNAKQAEKGSDLESPLTEQDIDNFFEKLAGRGDGTDAPTPGGRMMNQQSVKNLATVNPSQAVKIAADAIATNNSDKLERLIQVAPATNAIIEMAEDPEYSSLQGLLVKLKAADVEKRKAAIAAAEAVLDDNVGGGGGKQAASRKRK